MVLAVVAAVTVLLLTLLHAAEATAWAGAYVAVGARPDFTSAMLYSLSAMTSYGHANIFLAEDWQLMGAIEALNGCSDCQRRSYSPCFRHTGQPEAIIEEIRAVRRRRGGASTPVGAPRTKSGDARAGAIHSPPCPHSFRFGCQPGRQQRVRWRSDAAIVSKGRRAGLQGSPREGPESTP